MNHESRLEELRSAYDQAFRRFVTAVRTGRELPEATAEYHQYRNALADYLLANTQQPPELADCAGACR